MTLSAPVFDVLGFVEIDASDEDVRPEISRRTSKTATLDGGVSVTDSGYSDGDIDLDIKWNRPTIITHQAVARLLQIYPRLVVSVVDGVFLAAPERYSPGPSSSRLKLLVIERLSI